MIDPVQFTPPNAVRNRCGVQFRPFLWVAVLFVLIGVSRVSGVSAQDGTPAQPPDPKETLQLVDTINDIDHLRSLNPLKLTTDQLDRAIALFSSAQATYQKKLNQLAADRVIQMSAEIRAVKQKMLDGGELPQDIDKRLQKASTDFIAKRAELDLQNIASIAGTLKEMLNAEQVKAAVAISRDAPSSSGKSAKATDTQWFNLYVAEVMLDYPRILPLLKEMRAQRGRTGAGSDSRGNQ